MESVLFCLIFQDQKITNQDFIDTASPSSKILKSQQTQVNPSIETRLPRDKPQNLFSWVREQKYKIAGATFVASMVGSFILVGRNPYLTGKQKIVQARVYAQGLTLAVIVSLAAFEISDRRKPWLSYSAQRKEAAKQPGFFEDGISRARWIWTKVLETSISIWICHSVL